MRQPYELSIAVRYLRTRSSVSFISFISAVSMIGIALAVAVLIVVLSVMNGFEHELQRRIIGMVSEASIAGVDGPLEDARRARHRVEDLAAGCTLSFGAWIDASGSSTPISVSSA